MATIGRLIARIVLSLARTCDRTVNCHKRVTAWLIFAGLLGVIVLALTLAAAHADEATHAARWCHQHRGQLEYVLPDRTRVDCLTATHAVEVEWAAKWYQAVGQSLHYAAMTGLRPGIVLLIQGDADNRYLARLQYVIDMFMLPIDVWELEAGDATRPADA